MKYQRIHHEASSLKRLIQVLESIADGKPKMGQLTTAEMEEIETELRDVRQSLKDLGEDLYQEIKMAVCQQ